MQLRRDLHAGIPATDLKEESVKNKVLTQPCYWEKEKENLCHMCLLPTKQVVHCAVVVSAVSVFKFIL